MTLDDLGSPSIRHQDAAGLSGAPLGVFHDSALIAVVPSADAAGAATREWVASWTGLPESSFEVLLTCPLHPTVAAVDCTTCVPEEAR